MDETIANIAVAYAKTHKKEIAQKLTDIKSFPADTIPITVFMAGSPGAGKTESSQVLLSKFTKNKASILRIDTDDLRELLPGYTGKNSSLFQGATSIIADKMQDLAIQQRQSYVFDGTLTNISRSRDNIKRNINKNREVYILYVYQDPLQAWKFVQARELRDGRKVPKESFIDQYFCARKNVNELKMEFGNKIHIDLIVKNIDGSDFAYHNNVDQIDRYIPEPYTEDDLQGLILE